MIERNAFKYRVRELRCVSSDHGSGAIPPGVSTATNNSGSIGSWGESIEISSSLDAADSQIPRFGPKLDQPGFLRRYARSIRLARWSMASWLQITVTSIESRAG